MKFRTSCEFSFNGPVNERNGNVTICCHNIVIMLL